MGKEIQSIEQFHLEKLFHPTNSERDKTSEIKFPVQESWKISYIFLSTWTSGYSPRAGKSFHFYEKNKGVKR